MRSFPYKFAICIAALCGCSSGSVSKSSSFAIYPLTGERCDSVADTLLAVSQSLEGLEGRYRLILVKTDSVWKPNGVFVGSLSLWRTSPNDSSSSGRRPRQPDDRSSVYFGATDIDAEAAELFTGSRWQRMSNPKKSDVDPIAPPVLGEALRGVAEGQAWQEFFLKIGTSSNDRSQGPVLDGVGAALNVRRITPRGFFGVWDRYGIVKTGRGYFCALRVPDSLSLQPSNTR
jgi:hypothetical protein